MESWTEMAPLVIVPPDCATRAKAACVQVWSPAGRKTRWLPLLKIPLTMMVVRERSMTSGVRITVGGAGGGLGGGDGGGDGGGGMGGGGGQDEIVPETSVGIVGEEQTAPPETKTLAPL